jgi:hypothetical protein
VNELIKELQLLTNKKIKISPHNHQNNQEIICNYQSNARNCAQPPKQIMNHSKTIFRNTANNFEKP